MAQAWTLATDSRAIAATRRCGSEFENANEGFDVALSSVSFELDKPGAFDVEDLILSPGTAALGASLATPVDGASLVPELVQTIGNRVRQVAAAEMVLQMEKILPLTKM